MDTPIHKRAEHPPPTLQSLTKLSNVTSVGLETSCMYFLFSVFFVRFHLMGGGGVKFIRICERDQESLKSVIRTTLFCLLPQL